MNSADAILEMRTKSVSDFLDRSALNRDDADSYVGLSRETLVPVAPALCFQPTLSADGDTGLRVDIGPGVVQNEFVPASSQTFDLGSFVGIDIYVTTQALFGLQGGGQRNGTVTAHYVGIEYLVSPATPTFSDVPAQIDDYYLIGSIRAPVTQAETDASINGWYLADGYAGLGVDPILYNPLGL